MADEPKAAEPLESPTPRTTGRSVNEVSWAPERARGGRFRAEAAPPAVGEPGGPSHRPGDVPPSLTRRYFTEALRASGGIAFYEGPGSKAIAFKDHGSRLVTDQAHPTVIRDLAVIAAHRGWTAVRVSGEDEFRREMWMEARALGLSVRGYRPKARDQQELDQRLEAERRRQAQAAPRRGQQPQEAARMERESARTSSRERLNFDAGVSGRLVDAGEAPYRRRTGQPVTPFLRIDRGDGRMLDVWGVGVCDALKRSGAKKGDAVHVRRDGVDVVQRSVEVRDPKTGLSRPRVRDVTRNRWIVEAERFRRSTPADAARDGQLSGAQSHLAVLNTVIDGAIKDPERREQLRAEAREIIAGELAQGRRFTPARIRQLEPVLARDVGQARAREVAAERAHRR